MARFDERSLQWTDVLGRFEARSHQRHLRDALAFIGRLKDEGRRFWPDGSAQLARQAAVVSGELLKQLAATEEEFGLLSAAPPPPLELAMDEEPRVGIDLDTPDTLAEARRLCGVPPPTGRRSGIC